MSNIRIKDESWDVFTNCLKGGLDVDAATTAMLDYRLKRFDHFTALNIDNVPDDVLNNLVLYAVNNGYEMDQFIELVEAKLFTPFEKLYELVQAPVRVAAHG